MHMGCPEAHRLSRTRGMPDSKKPRSNAKLGPPHRAQAIEASFQAFLDAAPDAMVIVGQDGRIRLVNGQVEKLFGYQRTELVGQLVDVLVPSRYRGQHPDHRAGYFTGPRPRPMGAGIDLFGLRKDGSEFPAEISLAPVDTAEGTFVTAAIRDISERKRAEDKF